MKITVEELEVVIAKEIIRQNGVDNVDNLGDTESIVLMGALPTINVVELSEKIINACNNRENGEEISGQES